MNVTGLAVFDRSLDKTGIMLEEIMAGLDTASAQEAYMALRATLHALRDRLTVNEAAQLGAQLPLVLRGVYYEGWQPAKTPHPTRHAEDFLAEVAARYYWHPRDADAMVRTALAVIARHVSPGEWLQVKRSLPKDIQTLLP